MAWALLILGIALIWLGLDALIAIGLVRPLSARQVTDAVLGKGSRELSEHPRSLAERRIVVQEDSLAKLLSYVFVHLQHLFRKMILTHFSQ